MMILSETLPLTRHNPARCSATAERIWAATDLSQSWGCTVCYGAGSTVTEVVNSAHVATLKCIPMELQRKGSGGV